MIMSFSYETFSCVTSATLKGLAMGYLVGLSSNTGHKNACVEVFFKALLIIFFQFNKRKAGTSCEKFSTDIIIIISSPWKESKLFF